MVPEVSAKYRNLFSADGDAVAANISGLKMIRASNDGAVMIGVFCKLRIWGDGERRGTILQGNRVA